jgi:hypothetical protein
MYPSQLLKLLALTLVVASSSLTQSPAQVIDQVDWQALLARHDLVWKRLPDRFENAAFTGNGQLGAMVFTTAQGKALKFQMGRSDVAFGSSRIPIGDLVLTPLGKILGGELRLDLWNAEVRGKLTTDRGEIDFRSFTHSVRLVNVIETTARGGEQATWTWEPGLATEPRKFFRKEPLTDKDRNDPPVTSRNGDLNLSFQPLKPAGGHATAWQVVPAANGRSVVYASVGFATQEDAAQAAASAAVNQALAVGVPALVESHRAWWHPFWPAGFVSIPDTRLEGFYYIQMYKMASATRPGRPAMDLMGPWFRATPWTKIWWNLNLQLAYWPQLTGNRLELGESLCELIDHGAPELANNAGPFQTDSAAIGRASGYDCVSPVGAELCNLPWAMHNYWLQYRYTMDEALLRRLLPMLKRSINYYLHQLKEGPDGRLHLTRGLSPEYENQPKPNPDCNIDLALLRWGCETLLAACQRLQLADPQVPQWQDTLKRLTSYPQDENGLMISATVPFTQSHRHYSHLLMIYPLYGMTPEQPENRALVVKSLKHWMGMPQRLAGYSFTGAASISALLGEGDEAARYLNKLLDSKIPPNTLYVEAGPCIETPLSAAASLNDMLLSSWGDRIRVFPGVPDAWRDISFHNLRTQGAFLVSAARKNGQTQWVRVKSLAGEPCRIRPGLSGTVNATVPLKPAGDGAYDLTLAKGQEAILYPGATVPPLIIHSVPSDPAKCNFYGLPKVR